MVGSETGPSGSAALLVARGRCPIAVRCGAGGSAAGARLWTLTVTRTKRQCAWTSRTHEPQTDNEYPPEGSRKRRRDLAGGGVACAHGAKWESIDTKERDPRGDRARRANSQAQGRKRREGRRPACGEIRDRDPFLGKYVYRTINNFTFGSQRRLNRPPEASASAPPLPAAAE